MISYCKENLEQIKNLIASLEEEKYQYKSQLLSDTTIGQHVRHILEFYLCIINGVSRGLVNYDSRERNIELEHNPVLAISCIDKICDDIECLSTYQEINLVGNFSTEGETLKTIRTSIDRELAYCLEHSIHHQALIKIGLIEQKMDHLINEGFGVAPATIRHKQQCAQ
ncbi:MAG: hypothetical protein Q8S11_06670 [Daejeonella sp.]|uniref:hypothetical protein n=1 Tax=Daejeonella sp. TaxID=2805397 RepID=UPI00273507C0|nr:hypothetical protein [Daejeonella sp.]MDP3467999.1 hypothetical protein [Daejeonella sp.]